jgi:hypothetical protein
MPSEIQNSGPEMWMRMRICGTFQMKIFLYLREESKIQLVSIQFYKSVPE